MLLRTMVSLLSDEELVRTHTLAQTEVARLLQGDHKILVGSHARRVKACEREILRRARHSKLRA